MKVSELTEEVVGKRIRVTKVAISESERLGYINDVAILTGQTGVATQKTMVDQMVVAWDREQPGNLMLCGDDEVEILD